MRLSHLFVIIVTAAAGTYAASAADTPAAVSTSGTKSLPTKEMFGSMFKPGATAAPSEAAIMHAKFESEPVDASWSANVEANARGYFDAQPSAATANVSMQCRSTMCEVLMVGNATGDVSLAQQQWEQWQRTVYMSPKQSWWTAFGLKDTVTNVSYGPDGQIKAVSYFTKNPITKQASIKY